MRLVLLGAPGAGKGTQAGVLSDRFQIPVISTGKILREAASQGTAFGKQAKSYTDRGLLVPDDLITPLVLQQLQEPDCDRGFLLDGFPRTAGQAEALDAFLAEHRLHLDAVLHLVVDVDELVRRLSGRRVCSKCGESYHIVSRPPKEPGVCDLDGAPLVQRDDDRPEPIRKRLEICERDTAAVVEYYHRQGIVTTLDGNRRPEEVTLAMETVLRGAVCETCLGEAR